MKLLTDKQIDRETLGKHNLLGGGNDRRATAAVMRLLLLGMQSADRCHVCMPVFSLYTPRGEKIHEPSQLVNGEVYVAVGSEHGGQFQHRHYGGTKFQLDRRGRKRYPFQWRKPSERYGWQQFTRGRLLES